MRPPDKTLWYRTKKDVNFKNGVISIVSILPIKGIILLIKIYE